MRLIRIPSTLVTVYSLNLNHVKLLKGNQLLTQQQTATLITKIKGDKAIKLTITVK